MPYLTLKDGSRLHYLDVGRGPPVVLLHGFGMQAAHFLPFVLPHARRHRFVMLDLRGFGGSRLLPLRTPDFLRSHADDVHEAMSQMRLDRPALGGISMGAATALAYLERHGFDEFRSYLHIDQSPRILNDATYRHGLFGDDQSQVMSDWVEVAERLEQSGRGTPYRALPMDLRHAFTRVLARFFSYAFHLPVARAASGLVRFEKLAKRFVDPENWPLYLDAIRAYGSQDYDFRPSLGDVKIPMQIFIGTESRMYPPAGQIEIRDHVPHAEIVHFARTGHAVPIEAPVRFVRALGRWLDGSLHLQKNNEPPRRRGRQESGNSLAGLAAWRLIFFL